MQPEHLNLKSRSRSEIEGSHTWERAQALTLQKLLTAQWIALRCSANG